MVTQTSTTPHAMTMGERAARQANEAGVDYLSYPGPRAFFPQQEGYDAKGTTLLRWTRYDSNIYLFADGSWVRWSSRFFATTSGVMTGVWYVGRAEDGRSTISRLPLGLRYENGAWRMNRAST